LGAFFSPIVCGILGDTGNPADFKWGFMAACVGMVVGVISFELMKKKYLVTPEGEAVGAVANKKRDALEAAANGDNATKSVPISPAKMGIWAVVLLALVGIFHFVLDQDWIGSSIFSVSIV